MSSIPPPGHAGLIQAHGAQRVAGEKKAQDASRQAGRTQTDPFAERLKEAIENDDLDSQVYADGEGNGGGQGRAFSDQPPEDTTDQAGAPESDATARDDQPPNGIDLQA